MHGGAYFRNFTVLSFVYIAYENPRSCPLRTHAQHSYKTWRDGRAGLTWPRPVYGSVSVSRTSTTTKSQFCIFHNLRFEREL